MDLDTGIDDSIALAYAAMHPDVDLLAVTGTFGNIETPIGVRNALDVLALVGRSDIPVYEGRSCALGQDTFCRHDVSADIHGQNGVGNLELPASPREAEKEYAVDYLIRKMQEIQEDLVIVTTGPLSNLAEALVQEPSLQHWPGRVVSMGGAVTARGNVSHFAEANISQDPEAAKLVLESSIAVTLVPLDVTMRSRMTSSDVDIWRASGSPRGKVLSDMLQYYIKHTLGTDETYVHDPSAVICALHPEYFTMLPSFLTVELEGADRGRIIVDHARLREPNPPTRACIQVDAGNVERELRQCLSRL